MKKWTVSRINPDKSNKINSLSDLGPFLSEIAVARGLDSPERLIGFFNVEELSDPFLLSDMSDAVNAINSAVDSGERIAVFGDYDCDGICSTAILYDYLLSMGADVLAFVPERDDGYGLNMDTVEKLHKMGCSLIVTVDNGISAINEAKRIKELGMKLVVTDHHQPSSVLPEAEAVVNPHRQGDLSEFKDLCGAGVALKLCAALDGGGYDAVCEQYLDLCAVATVADVMPLVGENRIIVRRGIELLKNTENLGLTALMAGVDRQSISSQFISFGLAPKINAASRFGSAKTALDLLCCDDPETAEKIAADVLALNRTRRENESGVILRLVEKIDCDRKLLNSRLIIVSDRGLPHGLIGIIAARLADLYEKPTIVLSIDDDGVATGSARSVKGFNVFKCFNYCSDLFIKFGGHELAGGLTINEADIPSFIKRAEEYAENVCPIMPKPEIHADKLLRGEDIKHENAVSLLRFCPFGTGNPEPIFAMSGAQIIKIIPLTEGEHTKIVVSYDGKTAELLLFRTKTSDLNYHVGDYIDVMVNMRAEEYNGNKIVSLIVLDHRPHGIKQDNIFAAENIYERFRRGEKCELKQLLLGIPSRDEMIKVYKLIGKEPRTTLLGLYSKLIASHEEINALKLRIIIDIFCDTGLLEYRASEEKITVVPPKKKADIESSETLIKLRELTKLEE